MKPKLLLLLWGCLLGGALGAQAQDSVRLVVNDVVTPGGGEPVCVPVVANELPDIVSFQFSLQWDTTKLRFTELRLGNNPLGLGGSDTSLPDSNTLIVLSVVDNLSGITLDSGTVVFQLCFTTRVTNDTTTIRFTGPRAPEFVQEGAFTPFPFVVTAGVVTFDFVDGLRPEPAWAHALVPYPNPVTDNTLHLGGPLPPSVSVQLFAADGRLVRSFPPRGGGLYVGDLAGGTYLLRLRRKGAVVTRRIVLVR